MENLTDQEVALLLAMDTKIENGKLVENENAMNLEELAAGTETSINNAANTLALLTTKNILEPIEAFNGIVYGYADNDYAQIVYTEIHHA